MTTANRRKTVRVRHKLSTLRSTYQLPLTQHHRHYCDNRTNITDNVKKTVSRLSASSEYGHRTNWPVC